MSSRYQLTAQEIADLESAYRQTSDKRYADRLERSALNRSRF